MTAKIYQLSEHRAGRTQPKPAAVNDQKRQTIELVKHILIKAGYSPDEALGILLPLALPPGNQILRMWSHNAKVYFEDELNRYAQYFPGFI